MQVIVSACFSLYTYESNPSAAHITATSIANNSLFHHKQKSFQPQLTATSTAITSTLHPQNILSHIYFATFFIIRAITFRSINAPTALKRSQATQYSQYYLFARRRKIKGQKQDLSSHSRPLCFINSPKRVLFRYAFLLFSHANAPLKHSESNKTPISFSSKYIDQSFYIDASPPCPCVVPFSNQYTSPQKPHRF